MSDPCGFTEDGTAHTCTDGTRTEEGVAVYTCTCQDGYSFDGITCVVDDPCVSTPCLNGGVCNWSGGEGFDCQCGQFFSGDTCQFFDDPCSVDNDPCENGSICQWSDSLLDMSCDCTGLDFTGDFCDTPLYVMVDNLRTFGPWERTCIDRLDGGPVYQEQEFKISVFTTVPLSWP